MMSGGDNSRKNMKSISRIWGGQTKHFWGDRIEQRSEGSEVGKPLEDPWMFRAEGTQGQRALGGSLPREAHVAGMGWEQRTAGGTVVSVGRSQVTWLVGTKEDLKVWSRNDKSWIRFEFRCGCAGSRSGNRETGSVLRSRRPAWRRWCLDEGGGRGSAESWLESAHNLKKEVVGFLMNWKKALKVRKESGWFLVGGKVWSEFARRKTLWFPFWTCWVWSVRLLSDDTS